MSKLLPGFISALLISAPAIAADGLVSLKSAYDVTTTANRLEESLKAKGMTVFARIDHAAGAEKAGLKLRPTELVLFGNPKSGTPLMLCGQSMGIDLPQKALIMEDEAGQVWFTYNDPAWLAKRHKIKGCEEALNKITNALGAFAKEATQ